MAQSGLLRQYKSLLPYFSRYKWRYIFGLLFLILVDAAQIIVPQFIKQAVDLISTGSFEWTNIMSKSNFEFVLH